MATGSYHAYLALFGILLLAAIVRSQDLGFEESLKELLAKRKNLDYVKQLVDDMDNQLNRLQRGQNLVWASLGGPSKKRSYHNQQPQYSCDFKVGNPEGCLGKLIEGDNKDNTHWGDPDGPGK